MPASGHFSVLHAEAVVTYTHSRDHRLTESIPASCNLHLILATMESTTCPQPSHCAAFIPHTPAHRR